MYHVLLQTINILQKHSKDSWTFNISEVIFDKLDQLWQYFDTILTNLYKNVKKISFFTTLGMYPLFPFLLFSFYVLPSAEVIVYS